MLSGELNPSRWILFARWSRTTVTSNWSDVVFGLGLIVGAWAASFVGSGLFSRGILSKEAIDVWFDADLARVFDNMVSRASDNKRSDLHPFFALVGYTPVYILQAISGLDDWTAVRAVLALVAATCAGLIYALLRCIGLPPLLGVLFTLLCATSAAGMFWFILPETMPFGAVTILAGLLFSAVACRRPLPIASAVAVNLLTLSVTVTNWMVGILAAYAAYSKRQALVIVACTVSLAVCLSALQLTVFTRATQFGVSNRILTEDVDFLVREDAVGPGASVKAFVFHSMVMPKIEISQHYWSWIDWPILRAQPSSAGSGGPWGLISAVLWIGLLTLGGVGLATTPTAPAFRFVLTGTLLGQMTLHALFGRETFLYSAHFGPLLVLVAAYSTLTRWRILAIALASGLLVTVTLNNMPILKDAIAFVNVSRPKSYPLQAATDLSPLYRNAPSAPPTLVTLTDIRGLPIGTVGPGGSFSTGAGGFVLSLWVIDGHDVLFTSDTRWSPSTQQRVVFPGRGPPRVETNNWYYRVTANAGENGMSTLNIAHDDNQITRLAIGIRSSDRANPIHSIAWIDNHLSINDRWTVQVHPRPAAARVGEEVSPHRFVSRGHRWESSAGVGYALIELDPRDHNWTLAVTDKLEASRARQ